MSDDDEIKEDNEDKGKIQNYIAIAILIGAYLAAVFNVISVKKSEIVVAGDGEIVLRMTHWQLEAGFREAIDEQIKGFEKVYKENTGKTVRVIQNPINEKAYRQYVQTQCIGGTAPDLIQIGFYDKDYTRRFFMATNEYVNKPNPYNKGTNLEGVPWAETFIDGMYSALDQETLEYYGSGISMVTVRLFYNKEILRSAFGKASPPKDYREFLQMCEDLRKWAKKEGVDGFVPIAGSQYQLNFFKSRYSGPLTFDLLLEADLSQDGTMAEIESGLSYIKGIYNTETPQIKAAHKAVGSMTKQFPVGFMAMQRMDAGFAFTRRKAAFIASGVWDANGYIQNADFPIGVCDFPLPSKTDDEFGRFLAGPQSEASIGTAVRFGVTKFSKHPDVAVNFLMYLTAQKNNEILNREFKWLPSIKGSKVFGLMVNFMPRAEGFWSGNFFGGGSKSKTTYEQSVWGYNEHKIGYEEFAKKLNEDLPEALAQDLMRYFRSTYERRLVLDATFTCNMGVANYALDWGLPEKEGVDLRNLAIQRQRYLWEGRISNLGEIQFQQIFKDELAKDNKLALQVRKLMTDSPFVTEE